MFDLLLTIIKEYVQLSCDCGSFLHEVGFSIRGFYCEAGFDVIIYDDELIVERVGLMDMIEEWEGFRLSQTIA
jgi:hypothetical protein